jgi:hypothetical protein
LLYDRLLFSCPYNRNDSNYALHGKSNVFVTAQGAIGFASSAELQALFEITLVFMRPEVAFMGQ